MKVGHNFKRLLLSRLAVPALIMIALPSVALAEISVNVEITGISSKLETNVRQYLSIEQQKNHPLITEGRLKRLQNKAHEEIALALQPFGFYRPTIESSLIKSGSKAWQASYQIDSGTAIPVARFDLIVSAELTNDPAFAKILNNRPFKAGEAFNHIDYEAFKSEMARIAAERGYFDAEFVQHRVEIDLNQYVARVTLDYVSGQRYRFGEIRMQQDVLNQSLLQRMVPFEPGDPYHLDQLIEMQKILNDSNYFSVAEVSAVRALAADGEIPIEVRLTPRKNNRFDMGLGYGTDSGARASFGWSVPRVNAKGHRFQTAYELSQLGHKFEASYRVPIFNPRRDQLVYSIGEEKEEFENTETTLLSIGLSLNHSRGDWRETLSMNYQQENFRSGDDQGDTALLIPSVSWNRIWGDDVINAIDGLRLDFNLRGADQGLGSDIDFIQFRTQIKFISSLTPRTRLIARGEYGATSTQTFDQIPSSVRFFSGGSKSVRGYAYHSLGPIDADGEVIGGANLILGSLELEHFFNDNWGVAAFIDIGNAIDDLDDDLNQGAGLGLRWKSPIGLLRIDLGNALSISGQPWRLHLTIGPDL